jgi:parallel beta-helix repeat protein
VEVTDNELSNNEGIGVYVQTGNQVSIARNMIEGNGGPGIFAYDSIALDLNSNYFESNCVGVHSINGSKPLPFILKPPPPTPGFNYSGAGSIVPNADIVVSGSPLPYYGASFGYEWPFLLSLGDMHDIVSQLMMANRLRTDEN